MAEQRQEIGGWQCPMESMYRKMGGLLGGNNDSVFRHNGDISLSILRNQLKRIDWLLNLYLS